MNLSETLLGITARNDVQIESIQITYSKPYSFSEHRWECVIVTITEDELPTRARSFGSHQSSPHLAVLEALTEMKSNDSRRVR